MSDRIKSEAERLEALCLLAAERHYAAETPWYHLNYFLGIPSTIIAATAAVTALSNPPTKQWVTAVIALLAAALSALLTFLDPYKHASVHHATARSYEALYHSSGRFLRLELTKDHTDPDVIEKTLGALTNRFDEVLQSSPALPGSAYKTAERNLGTGKGEVLRVFDDRSAVTANRSHTE
jgi:hypothetical protein